MIHSLIWKIRNQAIKKPPLIKGTEYPRYHPVSHEKITGTSCLLNAQLTSSPTVTSERKLRWEIQEPSEPGEAYSRWLPFSVRKWSSINTFTAFLSFNTMPQGLPSVKRKVRILWNCFFHFLSWKEVFLQISGPFGIHFRSRHWSPPRKEAGSYTHTATALPWSVQSGFHTYFRNSEKIQNTEKIHRKRSAMP